MQKKKNYQQLKKRTSVNEKRLIIQWPLWTMTILALMKEKYK